jgi:predicted nucleotidyltransferase
VDPRIADIVERLERALADLGVRVSDVVVFGSHATGDAAEDSDIDLAVISGDFADMDLVERLETVGLALARAQVTAPVEALAYTPAEYESPEPGTFVGDEIKAKGVSVR